MNNKSTSFKYFKTVCVSLAFLSLGLYVAVIGPTLPTLAYNLQVHIDTMAYIIPARAVGYLAGSIVSGLVYKRFDPHLLLFISLFAIAAGTVFVPYLNSVIYLAVIMTTVSISTGFLDTSGNVMCLQIWGEKSGPFLQTLHFAFALGTTLAPLLAMPFIMEVQDQESQASVTSSYKMWSPNATSESPPVEKFYLVSYAYIVCAVITGVVALSFLYLAFFHRGSSSVTDQKNTVKEEGNVFRIKMLFLLFVFFLLYVGNEVAFGVFIYTFAITSDNHYTKSEASLLNSLFWGAFAVGRFIAIPVSKFLPPSKALQIDLLGTTFAAVVLVCFPFYAKAADFLLWIGVTVYGLSMASIFPTGISWAEQYITITEKAATTLVIGAATGEMIFPTLVGQLIDSNPMYLMYLSMGSACACTLNYILLDRLAKTKGKRLKSSIGLKEANDEQKASPLLKDTVAS